MRYAARAHGGASAVCVGLAVDAVRRKLGQGRGPVERAATARAANTSCSAVATLTERARSSSSAHCFSVCCASSRVGASTSARIATGSERARRPLAGSVYSAAARSIDVPSGLQGPFRVGAAGSDHSESEGAFHDHGKKDTLPQIMAAKADESSAAAVADEEINFDPDSDFVSDGMGRSEEHTSELQSP